MPNYYPSAARRLAVAGIAVALLVAVQPIAGQQQPPTFRTGVDLITVDVAVFDRDGRPVPGVDAGVFEVKINGRVQPVKLVSYLEARGELEPEAPAATPERPAWDGRAGRQTISNAGVIDPTAPAGEDRVFVILVDDLSLSPTRGQRLLVAAQRFVESLPASDPVGLVRSSNSLDAVNPTLDRPAIIEALKRTGGSLGEMTAFRPQGAEEEAEAGPDGYVGVARSLEIDSGNLEPLKESIAQACFNGDRALVDSEVLDVLIANNNCASQVRQQARQTASMARRVASMQLNGYEAIIRAMGSADGIRHLVLVSDGLAIGREVSQLRPLATAAAEAGVQVSVLMEEPDLSLADAGRRAIKPPAAGVTSPPPPPQADIGAAQRRIEDQRMYMSGLQTAADIVGGQFYRIVGDPIPFFDRVRTASAAIYRLGVEPPAGLQPGRTIEVDARVLRSGVNVFVNRHALVPTPAPVEPPKPVSIDDRLQEVLALGQQHGAVPLQVATLLRRAGASEVELTINLGVPPGPSGPVRGPLVAMFALAPPAGQSAAGAQMPSGRRTLDAPGLDGTFRGTFGLPAAPGAYRLRVAVADAEGALGAVEAEVDTTLPTIGPFGASDLLVAWVDGTGQAQLMALDPLPAAATGVRADLELYPPAVGVDMTTVQVELSVTRLGDADPADERLVTPRLVDGVWRVAAEFGADQLDSGRYTVRARVYVGDDVVGSAIATFTKS